MNRLLIASLQRRLSSRSRAAAVGIYFHYRVGGHAGRDPDPDTRSLRSLLRDDSGRDPTSRRKITGLSLFLVTTYNSPRRVRTRWMSRAWPRTTKPLSAAGRGVKPPL